MGTYAPGEAARALGIAPTKLRKWTAELADWLSPTAGDTRNRRYTEGDLDVLRRAGDLLGQRYDFAAVRERLAEQSAAFERERVVGEEFEQPEPVASPGASAQPETTAPAGAEVPHEQPDASQQIPLVDAEVVEPEPRVPPDIAAMLERMAELYRELLRDKEQELAALRRALDSAELLASNTRGELETLHRLSAMLERENGRLAAELAATRDQLDRAGRVQTWRARLARWFGRSADEPLKAEEAA